ncbi:MAG: hypothetical protein ABMA64_39230, partial [Myxococcota bacterium]
AVGCAAEPHEGIQIGGEGEADDPCGRPTVRDVGWTDAVLEGRSAADAMATFGGPFTYTAQWFDGRSAPVTVALTADVDAAELTEYPHPEWCESTLEWPVTVALTSADGALDERWAWTVSYSHPTDLLDVAGQVPVADLRGTLDPAAIDPGAPELVVQIRLGAQGERGIVRLPDPAATEVQYDDTVVCGWDVPPQTYP